MTSPFAGKRIILGVTGGIAAYKVADWVRALRREGATVTVVMTKAAAEFVPPMTFAALSGQPVAGDFFAALGAETIPHIRLARDCDLLVVAPATAHTVSRLAYGMADTMLAAIALATKAKVVVFPAMNSQMLAHPATQDNLNRLATLGYLVIPPECGAMACGDEGQGRLPDWPSARERLVLALTEQDLAGQTLLVTAGPTQEPLDPVRFLSNRSSGKMGYALARAAHQRGAEVTLISGPTSLPPPVGVEVVKVRTALEMRQAVLARYEAATVIVKSAAVSDFRPEVEAGRKLKKTAQDACLLRMTPNPDILQELGEKKGQRPLPILVGFAAESDAHLEEGRRKFASKNLDLLVVNDIMRPDAGFAVDTNQVTIIANSAPPEALPLLSNEDTAHRILDRIRMLL